MMALVDEIRRGLIMCKFEPVSPSSDDDELITEFILRTCQVDRQSNFRAVQAIVWSTPFLRHDRDATISGSVAELYIEPMTSCIGDVDVMIHLRNKIALPAGFPIPRYLPARYTKSKTVDVYEMRNRAAGAANCSELPGFVYLYHVCALKRESNVQWTVNEEQVDRKYLTNQLPNIKTPLLFAVHGPAANHAETSAFIRYFDNNVTSDAVRCLPCFEWPPQAAEWPLRQRDHWPGKETIQRIISSGCDVVPVAHPKVRDDDWMREFQWRLSFSLAEIVLLNSWTPVQQIVYHMLRFLMKTERLSEMTDNSGRKVITNYHIKTLMLWEVEGHPGRWWNDKLVSICIKLLHTMSEWVYRGTYSQYFIPSCNLVDSETAGDSHQLVASFILSLSDTSLSAWYVTNYIGKCTASADRFPERIHHMFTDADTREKQLNAISTVISVNSFKCLTDKHNFIKEIFSRLATYYTEVFGSKDAYQRLKAEFCKVENGDILRHCQDGLWLLYAVNELQCVDGLTREVLDIICMATNLAGDGDVIVDYDSSVPSSIYLWRRAEMLMRNTRNIRVLNLRFLGHEMVKFCLYGMLKCVADSHSHSVYCLANVLLAYYYYNTAGDFHKTQQHCTLITRCQDHSLCRSFAVEGQLLPRCILDPDFEIALGFVLLCQHAITVHPNQRLHARFTTEFTTELLACALELKCFMRTTYEEEMLAAWQRYDDFMSSYRQPTAADIVLRCIICMRHPHPPAHSMFQTSPQGLYFNYSHAEITAQRYALPYSTDSLCRQLKNSAVQHLTMFRQRHERFAGFTDEELPSSKADFHIMLLFANHDDDHEVISSCYDYIARCETDLARRWLSCRLYVIPLSGVMTPLLGRDIVSVRGLGLLRFGVGQRGELETVTSLTMVVFVLLTAQYRMNRESARSKQIIAFLRLILRAAELHPPSMSVADRLLLSFIYRKIRKFYDSMRHRVMVDVGIHSCS